MHSLSLSWFMPTKPTHCLARGSIASHPMPYACMSRNQWRPDDSMDNSGFSICTCKIMAVCWWCNYVPPACLVAWVLASSHSRLINSRSTRFGATRSAELRPAMLQPNRPEIMAPLQQACSVPNTNLTIFHPFTLCLAWLAALRAP